MTSAPAVTGHRIPLSLAQVIEHKDDVLAILGRQRQPRAS
jgi:hypothetical protein